MGYAICLTSSRKNRAVVRLEAEARGRNAVCVGWSSKSGAECWGSSVAPTLESANVMGLRDGQHLPCENENKERSNNGAKNCWLSARMEEKKERLISRKDSAERYTKGCK